MQDSANMFEMTPAERIDVFKNIFGLLNIDEAKDVISDAKKETTALLKSRRNVDDVNIKLQRLVSEYISMVANNNERLDDQIISHANDRDMVKEKLSIENFDIASLPLASWQQLLETYDQQRSKYQSLLWELQALEKQLNSVHDEKENTAKQKTAALRNIEELEKKLQTDNSELIKKLQQEKQSLTNEQQQIVDSLPLKELGLSWIYELNTYISELTQKWKMLKQTKEILDQKLQLVDNQLKDIEKTRENTHAQLELVKTNRSKNEFICDLIGNKPCPYVDLINSAYAKNIDQQESLLLKQLEWLDQSKKEAERAKVIQEINATQADYENAINYEKNSRGR